MVAARCARTCKYSLLAPADPFWPGRIFAGHPDAPGGHRHEGSGSGARRAHRSEAPYPNPRKVEYEPLLALLRDAFEGGVRQDEKLVARPGFEPAAGRREALNRGIISPEEDLH